MKILVNGSYLKFIDLNHILLDRAFEYIQKCQNVPCVWYQINIQQSGKASESLSLHFNLSFPFICECRKYSCHFCT